MTRYKGYKARHAAPGASMKIWLMMGGIVVAAGLVFALLAITILYGFGVL